MRIKDKSKLHDLSERQLNQVRLLNIALNYNELKNRIISGYFYEICINQFGYPEDQNLGFEIDLDSEEPKLKVMIVPNEVIEKELGK
jgi:hypothetical protein